MFLGLQDFDVDIFLRMDDQNIHIYYIDFETLPQLANIVPLGSFDADGKFPLVAMNMEDRIQTGMEFLHRDFYAEYEEGTMRSMIRVDRFLEQFSNIPEVMEFFTPYLELCEGDNPPDWCTDCSGTSECPEYCEDKCSISIPVTEFIKYNSQDKLRFKTDVPASVLTPPNVSLFPNLVQIAAKVETFDSNGNVAYGEDNRVYNLYDAVTAPSNLSQITSLPVDPNAAIIINPIPISNITTPTFTGNVIEIYGSLLHITIKGISNSIEIIEDVFYNPDNTWSFTVPDDTPLVSGEYKIFVQGLDQYNNQITSSMNFIVDTEAVIFFTDINDGVINLEDTTSNLSIKGGVQSVEDNSPVVVLFNEKEYSTVVINQEFEIIILYPDLQVLLDGLSYIITATVEDVQGNIGETQASINVDLSAKNPIIIINPEIDATLIQQHIDSGEKMLIDGDIEDAEIGDNVTVYVNRVPYRTAVYREEFILSDITLAENVDYSDLYYLIVLYFNGIYRVEPLHVQDFSPYELLTDINFEINNYSLIINIKEFFTKQFIYFLKCLPGSLPFGNDYGSQIKLAIQTKNFIIQRLEVQTEIKFFIKEFNNVYGDIVYLKDIIIVSRESDIGADSWLIEVYADIKKERLVYRLEV